MASDYSAISQENSRKYGTDIDRYGPVLLAHLYSDRTHFVYELLQNAEDASASAIRFSLFHDRLEVSHDGRLFDTRDVKGICGLVEGTKKDDLTQIGKFGIGFKSVYAYTDTPEVHSGDEHFAIDRYVHPRAVSPDRVADGETAFIFPFNRSDVPAESAFQDIRARLSKLGASTLLFLRNLNKISWESSDGSNGCYVRQVEMEDTARRVYLKGFENNELNTEENWLAYRRSVDGIENSRLNVEIAFRFDISDDPKPIRIVPTSGSPLVAFFPTEKETNLGFLIQGPYRTTPARDNIPKDAPWNLKLIEETCLLLGEALRDLRDRGLLGISCLEALPIRPMDFPEDCMFRPIYHYVRTLLGSEALIPTAGGDFMPASQTFMARRSQLRQLLTDSQLQALHQLTQEVSWLSDEVSQDRTPDLRGYLMQELGIVEVGAESFARQLHVKFLKEQSDEWMIRFYTFLDGQRAVWKSTTGLRPALHGKAYIRLDNDEHVPPFKEDGSPNAYLPCPEASGFPMVKPSIADDPDARNFLKNLGLSTPDIVAEVMDVILIKYQGEDAETIADEENLHDLERIIQALKAESEMRLHLLSKVRMTPFLRALNACTGELRFVCPAKAYFRLPELEMYFGGNGDAWFLGEGYERYYESLREMGVEDKARLFRRTPQYGGFIQLVYEHSRHSRGLDGFDPDCNIHGLAFALDNPDEQKSAYVWNELLLARSQWIRGEIEHCTRQDFSGAERVVMLSEIGTLACDKAWLPDPSGSFRRPSELALDDLSGHFKHDEILAKQLGMKTSSLYQLAKETGIDLKILDVLKKHLDKFKRFAEEIIAEDEDSIALEYEDELMGRFAANGGTGGSRAADDIELEECTDDQLVGDPERRRSKISSEIKEGKEAEPAITERFGVGFSTRWECKNPAIRQFLQQQYDGRCQICGYVFPKKNGQPYFEALYLVSRQKAAWFDRPGNALSLCPTCCAKLMHGQVGADDLVEQVRRFRAKREGGAHHPVISITLCGESASLCFSEKHMLDLQELLNSSQADEE